MLAMSGTSMLTSLGKLMHVTTAVDVCALSSTGQSQGRFDLDVGVTLDEKGHATVNKTQATVLLEHSALADATVVVHRVPSFRKKHMACCVCLAPATPQDDSCSV